MTGLHFTNMFTQIPKVKTETDGLTILFALLGSGRVKATHVGEIDPGLLFSVVFLLKKGHLAKIK